MQKSFENKTAAEKPKRIYTYRDNSDPEKPIVFQVMSDSILKADELYEKETGNDPKKQSHIGCSVENLLERQKKEFDTFVENVLEKKGLNWEEYAEQEEKSTYENYLSKLDLAEQALKGKKILDIGADKCFFASYCLKNGISGDVYSVEGSDEGYMDKKAKEAIWSEPVKSEIAKRTVRALMQKMPFEDGSFELVVCNAAMPGRNKEYFGGLTMEQDIDKTYDEIVRVLKPGGEARLEPFEDNEDDELFGDWARATKRKLEDLKNRGVQVKIEKIEDTEDELYRIIIKKDETQ